jgi:hypothetical protein
MSYIGNSKDNTFLYTLERNLLLAGLSYSEIAHQTGQKQKTISERNRLIYKINTRDAFERRCLKEGVPSRMPLNINFCAWFSGFFDGEGSIVVFTRTSSWDSRYSEFRLGVRIQIRHDDTSTLEYLRENIGCGRLCRHKGRGNAQDSISWACEKIKDLREVIVPLFDAFPLRTKKRKEYILWKPLVLRRYLDMMGGESNRSGINSEYKTLFNDAIHKISEIRRGR